MHAIFRLALAVALILLVPLVAMQFSDQVKWSFEDFAIAGALLFGTGLLYGLVARRVKRPAHRALLATVLALALLLAWADLAVGVFSIPGVSGS